MSRTLNMVHLLLFYYALFSLQILNLHGASTANLTKTKIETVTIQQNNSFLNKSTTTSLPSLLVVTPTTATTTEKSIKNQGNKTTIDICDKCRKECSLVQISLKTESTSLEVDLNNFLKTSYKTNENISIIQDIKTEKNESGNLKEDEKNKNITITQLNVDNSIKINIDWRSKYSAVEERNHYFRDLNLFTDCKFVVGSGSDVKIFNGHRVFFVRASPVFEAVFNSTLDTIKQTVKITDISPQVFEQVVNFVYSGSVCLTSFSEACELLHTALRLQLPELAYHCRAFLWTNLYPSNVWQGYQCAQDANDDIIKEVALQMIEWKTDDALKDPAFTKIPQSALVAFLGREDLNVSSEVKLYEASLRWSINEASRRGLPQEPESLRQVLGDALGLIRFLTFKPTDFANMQSTSKLLSYSESLSIIFNLNSPGVTSIPENLSSINKTRSYKNNIKFFNVISSKYKNCKNSDDNLIIDENTFNLFTLSQPIIIDRNLNLIGIQIPSQINCTLNNENENEYNTINNKTYYNEDLTVHILYNQSLLHTTNYKNNVLCDSLVTIKFAKEVTLQKNNNYQGKVNPYNYKIKVILHKSGRYPIMWHDNSFRKGTTISGPHNKVFEGCTGYYWYSHKNEFLYSLVSKNQY